MGFLSSVTGDKVPAIATSRSTPAAAATLSVSPSSLSFSYQQGGSAPASQPIMVTSSSGTQLAYTVAASGGAWLSATPMSGTTPGTVNVSLVNPASMTVGTYNDMVTITAPAGSPQTVAVTLVVSAGGGTGNSSLKVSPRTLQFSYQTGNHMPSAKKLMITSAGAPLSYKASYSGGSPWLTVSPTGGTTPGTISVSVNPAGMPAGSHSGTIDVSAPGAKSLSVAVTLMVTSPASDDHDDEGGHGSGLSADAYVYDPMHSGAVAAQWVDGIGVPMHNAGNQGLLLSKNASGSAEAQAGAVIKNAQGLTLTELGFDVREGGQCSAGSPHFVVVTNDDVTHVVGGCVKGTTQTSLAIGWKRMRFDPSKPELASPPITPGQQVKSIAVMLDQGPEAGANAGGGLVVLDNITINGKVVAKK